MQLRGCISCCDFGGLVAKRVPVSLALREVPGDKFTFRVAERSAPLHGSHKLQQKVGLTKRFAADQSSAAKADQKWPCWLSARVEPRPASTAAELRARTRPMEGRDPMKKSGRLMWITAIAVSVMPTNVVQLNGQDMGAHKHHHYQLIDLGTLGGAQSTGGALNNKGSVVGCADTSTPDPNYPNFNPFLSPFGADPFIFHTFEFKDGRVTDMGALPGANSSCEDFLTDRGLIVGGSENGLIDPLTGWPAMEAVAWHNGQVINLGTFGGNESFAIGANNRGEVVGAAANTVPDPYSVFFGWGTQTRAFLWTQSQGLQDLGTLGGPDALATNINDRGQIFGASYTSDVPNRLTSIPPFDAFLYENGKMTDIPNGFGGTQVNPFGANNRGELIGNASFADEATGHPFLWRKGEFIDLGTFGGTFGDANSINDAGAVTGGAGTSDNSAVHGFFWKKGVLTDIGTVDRDDCSVGLNINSANQIVGVSAVCDGSVLHAFLWENGKIVDLNSLISHGSDLQLQVAGNINGRGEIAGFGVLPNGDKHAFLLVPCDDKHHGVEGCDYSMVEASATASVDPTTHATPGWRLPISLWQRGSRFRFPRPFIGQTN
jgi:probable HAF family extracellular repeat protein